MADAAAGRVGDPITHTGAFADLVQGAVAGALVGVALGALVVATGGVAGIAIASTIAAGAATGASLGGTVGELWGKHHAAPAGRIVTGSSDVFINGLPSAFVSSMAACDTHSGPQPVAEGSSTVFINGRPAARTGDHGACGFVVGQGSPDVFLGGAPVAPRGYASEVPWYAEATLLVLGLAGGGISLAVKGLGAAAIAARLGGSLVGSTVLGSGAHYAGGKQFGEGSVGQDVVTVAGALVGGGGGYRGGAVAEDAVTLRANPFRYYMNKAATVDVGTPRNKALFYSGRDASGVSNGAKAEGFSRAGGGHMRIEDTPGGQWMNDQKLYDNIGRDQADQVWRRLSQRYASQARGEVGAFVEGADPNRVFHQVERPILENALEAGRVTKITYNK